MPSARYLPLSPSPPLRLSVSLSLCLSLLTAVAAQEGAEEEESPYRPGLIARYSAAGNASATRIDETIAFDWQDAPPDPRLPGGPFQASWTGRLWTQVAGQHRLAIYAAGGKVTLKLGGRELINAAASEPAWFVSDPLELEFDRHPLEVNFDKIGPRARMGLYWLGPGFGLEPVPERFLMHDRQGSPASDFERGRRLAAALRCGACHSETIRGETLPAPALDKLSGNIEAAWLVDWLSKSRDAADNAQPTPSVTARIIRRMPHFGLTRQQAADIAAWLVRLPAESPPMAQPPPESDGTKRSKSGKAKGSPPKPSAEEGQRLFLTLGCLACHQHGELGESGLFGGGDLTEIAAKRPPEFFAHWLADPASTNRHHRMPVFELSTGERSSLALWLASGEKRAAAAIPGDATAGEKLVAQLRCASCHALPGAQASPKPAGLRSLTAASDWSRSCTGKADARATRPGYRLAAADQAALNSFYAAANNVRPTSAQVVGRDLLVELNCLACHAREGIDRATNALPARLQDKLAAVVAIHDEYGKEVPAMTPPALNSVGDKLHDAALADAIERKGPPHRPYLLVRMPRFNLTAQQLAALTAYFTATDRIPVGSALRGVPNVGNAVTTVGPTTGALAAAGPRLVTTDGFGCTSCHQVGSVLPDKTPLNARGPDLSLLDKRIRREWFRRWCANPARIVPRMEMPSVQIPVRGVLNEKIDDQLAAVWNILNTPGFEPPEPNPVRVLRLSGVPEKKERPIVLHDVIKAGDKTYLFPLVIGLPNRHNILFDLETNRLAAWWLGDTARQRTKGKSWYWEVGEKAIFEPGFSESGLSIVIDGKERFPQPAGQFIGEFVSSYCDAGTDRETAPARALFRTRLSFGDSIPAVEVDESYFPNSGHRGTGSGFRRMIEVKGTGNLSHVRIRLVGREMSRECKWNKETRMLSLPDKSGVHIHVELPARIEWNGDGTVALEASNDDLLDRLIRPREKYPSAWAALLSLDYVSDMPPDQYVIDTLPAHPAELSDVRIAPGFYAKRLPLASEIMPSAFTWDIDGNLVFATLKGQVLRAADKDGDRREDTFSIIADGLATPYGAVAQEKSIDVVTKNAVVRLNLNDDGEADGMQALAWGWGYTDDYHDWAVGLVRGDKGEYYIGLPCQQDQRSDAAAKHRGQLLKLIPRAAMPDNPRLFDIEVISSGHRFPMGLARNWEGELFVTDNQGNYNPFNELNHVRPGAHFGFINELEKQRGYKPLRYDKPAIDIPHPWTRSVNGICFLDTPEALRESTGKDAFGPLEGHLIGCEYDTRQLIRMTLQKVGDTYQGAAYPLSIPPENVEDGLLGPLVCAVSPRGELYVGNIRDSGWGAGNNVGDIVQIKIEPEKLPCGIAEVRATSDGFTLDFFRPVDRAKAGDAANYSIASYRREPTPAYGGPNLDRRIEKVSGVEVSPDARRVTLRLAQLREGFLYEFQLKPLVRGKEPFHPAEAHYTLNRIPQ